MRVAIANMLRADVPIVMLWEEDGGMVYWSSSEPATT